MIVGLTGGIGSGKSAVSHRFQQLGIEVVDADEVAREVVAAQSPALNKITAHFGNNILNTDSTLNRRELRNIIFTDPAEKKWLENLLHPIIRTRIIELLGQANSPYVILSSPLLIETDQHQLVERILVVDADESLQIERARARDNSDVAQIKKIISTQLSRDQRCNQADDIIHNHGNLLELDEKVKLLHQQYLTFSQDRS